MIRKLYPSGKKKAFNITYDDGVTQDIRFVQLLNKYQLKGTFNLNSLLLENEFEWIHESGLVVKRLKTDDVKSLYKGHEIASHTLSHPYMDNLTKEEIMYELFKDKENLEKIFGKEINGFAIPFHYYSELIEQCVIECGFEYARISEESYSFIPQKDFYKWRTTIFHCSNELSDLTKKFIENEDELAIFQIVGHSYDLDVENKWDMIENIFKEITKENDIISMTNIELIRYLKAMDNADITDTYIQNNSNISLWFDINNRICEVKASEKVQFVGGI